MKYLQNQEEFEDLIGRGETDIDDLPPFTVVYFTAPWCGPCSRVDKNMLYSSLPHINLLICDIDKNDYTAGYCNIRKIPTFLVISKTKIIDTFSSVKTSEIIERINNLYNQNR